MFRGMGFVKYAKLYSLRDAVYGEIFGLNKDLHKISQEYPLISLPLISRFRIELFVVLLSWNWWRSRPLHAKIIRLERLLGLASERPFVVLGA